MKFILVFCLLINFYSLLNNKEIELNSIYYSNSVGNLAENYDDKIYFDDLDLHINSKYSNGNFTLVSEGTLPGLNLNENDFAFFTQYGESVFTKNGASEGNCGIVSITNGLAYYRKYGGFYQLPDPNLTVTVIPQAHSSHFSNAVLAGYTPKDSPVIIHKLYSIAREYAIDAGYYVNLGLNDTQTEYIYESTANESAYDAEFEIITSFTYMDIISNIINGVCMQLRTQNDVYYGGHGMFITGYKYYTGSIVYNNVSIDASLFYVSVFDGTANECWYDMTNISNIPNEYSRATNISIAKLNLSRRT